MNRAQRRAAHRGQTVEVCLSGCCAPVPRPRDRLRSGPVDIWEGVDGALVAACPLCDADIPLPLGEPAVGDVLTCDRCGVSGMLVD